jgi:hypothetical protein
LQISVVLSNRCVPPQSRAPRSSDDAYFDKRCPHSLLEEAHYPFAVAVVAASSSGTQNIELADLHGLPVIKRICPAYFTLKSRAP